MKVTLDINGSFEEVVSFIKLFSLEEPGIQEVKVSAPRKDKVVDHCSIPVVCLIWKDNELYLKQNEGIWEPVICHCYLDIEDTILTRLIGQIEKETKLSKTAILEVSRFEKMENSDFIVYNLYLRPGELIDCSTFTWKRFPKELLKNLRMDRKIGDLIDMAYLSWKNEL